MKARLVHPPSPVGRIALEKNVREIIRTLGERARIVDVGARARRWPGVWASDYCISDAIDVVGDANHLPFADRSLDGIVATYVLEHLPNPEQAVWEMWRVLRLGGVCYVETPFMFNFHGHESAYSDYARWTHVGLERLFRQFSSVETGVAGGVASAVAHTLREGIPILLTSKDSRTYWGLRVLLGWLFAPVHLLDRKALHHPKRLNVAAALYCKAVK